MLLIAPVRVVVDVCPEGQAVNGVHVGVVCNEVPDTSSASNAAAAEKRVGDNDQATQFAICAKVKRIPPSLVRADLARYSSRALGRSGREVSEDQVLLRRSTSGQPVTLSRSSTPDTSSGDSEEIRRRT